MLESILKAYPWFDHPEGMKFVEIERHEARSVGHWLFQPGAISAFHRVTASDEIWAIHAGSLLLHVIDPRGELRTVQLGANVADGQVPIALVPAGHWQAAELSDGEPFAFGSNICVPGFSYSALEIARRDDLCGVYPQHGALIARLTHERLVGPDP